MNFAYFRTNDELKDNVINIDEAFSQMYDDYVFDHFYYDYGFSYKQIGAMFKHIERQGIDSNVEKVSSLTILSLSHLGINVMEIICKLDLLDINDVQLFIYDLKYKTRRLVNISETFNKLNELYRIQREYDLKINECIVLGNPLTYDVDLCQVFRHIFCHKAIFEFIPIPPSI